MSFRSLKGGYQRTGGRMAGFVVTAIVLAACSDDSAGSGGAAGGAGGGGGAGGSEGGSTTQTNKLPCEIADIVESHCAVCHGDPPSSSAPQSLLSSADFLAPVPKNPVQNLGQRSVEMMQQGTMPPGEPVPAEEIAVFEAWVNDGMPPGDCVPVTVPDPILNAEPVCTSDDFWPEHADFQPGKSRAEMFPGMPCVDCHENPTAYGFDESPDDFIPLAGTIFPSGHEPDRCAGLDGTAVTDVVIRIEDANGEVFELKPNASGNFLRKGSFAVPYSASVVSPDGERAMTYKPSSGDCNLCHTAEGSDGGDPNSGVAPGRIVVPLPAQAP